jgi:hypothetical protein
VSRRTLLAVAILAGWAGGLGVLARREFFKGSGQRLAELALRISPETFYYTVEQNGVQVGFASSAIDTTGKGFVLKDAFAADLPIAGTVHRATATSEVRLSRGMALTDFTVQFSADSSPIEVRGRAEGDTAIRYVLQSASSPPDTQRLRVQGPVLLPTLVPLAVMLGDKPKVGRTFTVPMFDPTTMGTRDVTVAIKAESLFTIPDSAALDPATGKWKVVHQDTVRAWQVGGDDARYLLGWMDERGRLVESRQAGGLVIRRTAFEVAFENWRERQLSAAGAPTASRDVLETTAIAARIPLTSSLEVLKVRLGGTSLDGFDLDGGRQLLAGNLLEVRREEPRALEAALRTMPTGVVLQNRYAKDLAPGPLLQVGHPKLQALVQRLGAGARDKREVAERIVAWVHDSLVKEVTVSVPDALRILDQKKGDCNEHTQLAVALARTAGIPARMASGLAYVRGRFYFHAWPELYLGQWVAVDPTFGQFPADAAHLRFVTGGLEKQAALLRLLGTLTVDVLEPRPAGRGGANE